MSKQFRGKTCVYCASGGASTTGDHVVARSFFPVKHRGNLPQVPSCSSCNQTKSEVEHYLATVMPFGGQHADALQTLSVQVPPRLERNLKLRREIAAGMKSQMVSQSGGPWQRQGQIPLEGAKLTRLYEWIMRGLAFHNWGLIFDETRHVRASYFVPKGQAMFEQLMQLQAAAIVEDNLGDGVFSYRAVMSGADPHLTFWRMTLYGTEVQAEDTGSKRAYKYVYGFTVPKDSPVAAGLMNMVR